jgi:hypothetical protein
MVSNLECLNGSYGVDLPLRQFDGRIYRFDCARDLKLLRQFRVFTCRRAAVAGRVFGE